jgi:hypothetical protein
LWPVAEALLTRYELAEQAVGFFRFFAGPALGFPEQAASVVAAGLLRARIRRRRCGRRWPCTLRDRVLGCTRRRPWLMRELSGPALELWWAAGDADPSRIGPVWRIRLEGSPCRLSSSTQTRATPRFT